ncbi:hypothetical protein ACN47E_002001 [Coniothyrium glycines]
MAAQASNSFQGHGLQQPQIVGQQRNITPGQQQYQGQHQHKVAQGQLAQQQQYAIFDPKLKLFTLEKQKTARSWEDVVPEQQRVALAEIQGELTKFRRKHGNVAQSLREITSSNCRRIINELVATETNDLWKYNKTIQWRIASVNVEWERVSRSSRQLRRVEVILETEPSGFQEPVHMKPALGANQDLAQDVPKAGKQNNMPQNQFNQAKNMAQQKHNPAQVGAQGQQVPHPQVGVTPQVHANGPPPPPPPGPAGPAGHSGNVVSGALPPPPPESAHDIHGAYIRNSHRGRMPGSFPEPMSVPGMIHGLGPPVPDHDFLRHQKKKHKHHRGSVSSGSSSSSSSSLESDGESGSDSSSTGPVRIVNVDQDYNLVSPRHHGRSRHSKKSKKSHKYKSLSGTRDRSRSRSRPRSERHSHKRRDSDMIVPPPIGKHSVFPTKADSPRLTHSQLQSQPQPVHIHVHQNQSADESSNDAEQPRHRHPSMPLPIGPIHKDKRKLDKINTAIAMSRESSWDRASGTESLTESSAYTGEDLIFDKPERRPSLHHRPQSTLYPHPSNTYDDVVHNRQPHIRARHLSADDYPHLSRPRRHDAFFPDSPTRPLFHRRTTTPHHTTNPFTPAFPSTLHRAFPSYTRDAHDPYLTYPTPRYLTQEATRFNLHDIADAMAHINESRRAAAVPQRTQRHSTERTADIHGTGDEWEAQCTPRGHARNQAYRAYA